MEKRSLIDPLHSGRFILHTSIGVFLGIFLALLLSELIFPIGGRLAQLPEEMLPWNLNNVFFKPREKGFYLLSLFLGWLGGYIINKRQYTSNLFLLLSSFIICIFILNYFANLILQIHDVYLYFILISLFFGIANILLFKKSAPTTMITSPNDLYSFEWKPYLIIFFIIISMLIPRSFEEVAAKIGMEMHVVSFLIGPSLYFLGDHLVPGIDYFTQYSIGMGYLFSQFIGSTVEATMINYVRFLIIIMCCFYAQIAALLFWLYRSWLTASFISLLSLILLFHTSVHFFDPSSSVLRYPLLGITAGLLAYLQQKPSFIRYISLALAIACSLFLNTETGIITSAAVVIAMLFTSERIFLSMKAVLLLMILTTSFFISILYFVFGNAIFQPIFIFSLIEPLLIYGKIGFGGCPISWTFRDLNWFYNVVSPVISIATLALIAFSTKNQTNKPRLAVLAFFSITGLLMLFKYVNMSIVALWQMNSLGLLISMGWWLNVITNNFKHQYFWSKFNRLSIAHLIWIPIICFGLYLTLVANDVRNPSKYGLRSWFHYPSVLNAPFMSSKKMDFTKVSPQPSSQDIALITDRTHSKEQVAIIDLYDWTYLVNAHRPPLMFFLPSATTFTKRQLTESLERLKHTQYLFLPKNSDGKPAVGGPFQEILQPNFFNDYIFDGEGDRLTAWRRKNI